jgi:hypothetical protein
VHIWDDVENIRCPESGIHAGASIKHPLPPIAIRRGIFPHDINLLPSYKHPRLREKSSLCGLLTVPVWGPETLGSIEILGDTAPQTNTLHQALTACSLQSARQTFPQFLENRVTVPNIFQPIADSVAEYKVGNGLTNTAKCIRTVAEDPEYAEYAALPAPVPLVAEHSVQGTKGRRMAIKQPEIC